MSIPGAGDKEGFTLVLGCPGMVPTQRQLEAGVKEDTVESGVLGARNLVVSHDDLGVEREPFPRALLQGRNEGEKSCQGLPFPGLTTPRRQDLAPSRGLSKQGWGRLCAPSKDSQPEGWLCVP